MGERKFCLVSAAVSSIIAAQQIQVTIGQQRLSAARVLVGFSIEMPSRARSIACRVPNACVLGNRGMCRCSRATKLLLLLLLQLSSRLRLLRLL